jgi:mannose-6-phosphate isomerase-like protein (cupin superfamily)
MENPDNLETSTPPLRGGFACFLSKGECLSTYKWGDDCYGWNYVDTDALSIKQELMPPDTAEQLHYHEKASQFFFVLKGRATFSIDGEISALKPEQGIEILPGQQALYQQ